MIFIHESAPERQQDKRDARNISSPEKKQSCGTLGRSPTSSNAAALIFRVSVLIFEAKSHLHFVLAFTQQR